MAVVRLLVHVLLVLSSIGSSVRAAPFGEFDGIPSGCLFSTQVAPDGSSQTFNAVPVNECQTYAWQVSGTPGAPFALIFTDFSLTEGEILRINVNQLAVQTCNPFSSCPAVVIQPTPNAPSTVSLILQNHRQSMGTKRFSAVISSIGTRTPFDRSQSQGYTRSDCDYGMPTWGTVMIVFIVFFFLTVMCCAVVRCCNSRRQSPRSGQVIASNPLPNAPAVASLQYPSVIAAPPAYPQDDLSDNHLNNKFEMYKNTLKH